MGTDFTADRAVVAQNALETMESSDRRGSVHSTGPWFAISF